MRKDAQQHKQRRVAAAKKPPRANGSMSARVRADIERSIVSGKWPPGYRIPFERELVARYGCSRMTVHKALNALAEKGLIVRRRSIGSFVAAPDAERSVLEIQDFAEEAARLGVPYRHEIRTCRIEALDPLQAELMGLPDGDEVLHVVCVHYVNDVPSAYEDRVISLAKVPKARNRRFEDMPPGTWLLRTVPWTEAEHIIRARNVAPAIARELQIEPRAACLVLERQTWHSGRPVTRVEIAYPGDRHHFVGRFSPMEHGASTGTRQGRVRSKRQRLVRSSLNSRAHSIASS